MKPTPELIYEYRMSRERAEREARERREAACTAIPRLREIADQRRRLAFDTGLMIMRNEDSSELRNKVEQLDKEELNLLLSAGLPASKPAFWKKCAPHRVSIRNRVSQCFAPTYTRATARSALP